MAHLLDTTADFDTFARKVGLDTPLEREVQWKARYESAYPLVFRAFYTGGGSPDGRPAVARELSRIKRRVAEAAPVMRAHIEEIDPVLGETLGMPPDPSPLHVLMVGTFSTNAVVAKVGDDIAVLHCLEFYQTPEGAKVLVAHEATHAWQRLATGDEQPPETDPGWLAFSEGVATRASRELVPGVDETDYFWYGHPEVEDWLPWCQENRDKLLERFAGGFDESWTYEAFFGAGRVDDHWRVGYFVADEIVRRIDKPLSELVKMGVDEGKAEVKEVLGLS
ncbi:MAG TPA: hypothetical protein VM121_11820 [Acidimicrobiales bacterium]|nr:hypothetical protein [Acidimicrobiales bacterium]